MWKKADLCGEKAFDDLGLGTSAGTENLEDSLVESVQTRQSMAADGAALASVLALSLSAAAVLLSTV